MPSSWQARLWTWKDVFALLHLSIGMLYLVRAFSSGKMRADASVEDAPLRDAQLQMFKAGLDHLVEFEKL